jgi:nucleoid-associated protein EbfC
MPDFNELFKQAKEIQGKMNNMKEKLDESTYEGKAGGGLASVVVTGAGHMKSINIDKSLLNPDEKEMLEDLIMAAFNAAKAKVDAASEDAVSGALGDFRLPPGMKLF